MHKVDSHVLQGRSSTLEDRKRPPLEDQAVSSTKRPTGDKRIAPFPSSSFHVHREPVKLISLSLERKGDFDKKCPTFQRPVEVGQMSLDQDRRLKTNTSLLRFYCPVNPSSVKMDLSVGFDSYLPKPSRLNEGISPILEWITVCPEAFLPGSKNRSSHTAPCSPVKKKNITSPLVQQKSEKLPSNGSSSDPNASTHSTSTDEAPKNIPKRYVRTLVN